jgi:hypothetical protein
MISPTEKTAGGAKAKVFSPSGAILWDFAIDIRSMDWKL